MKATVLSFFVAVAAWGQASVIISNPTGQHGVTWPLTAVAPATGQFAPTSANVYRSATKGGPYTLVGTVPFSQQGTATFLDGCAFPPVAGCKSPFPDGSTWFYVFTGFNPTSNATPNPRTNTPGESVDSVEVPATFPTPVQTSPVTSQNPSVH